jgi:ketosteroid isomerase-like protein
VSVADTLRRGFAAFSAGDLGALLDLFTDDAVWTIPGETQISGAYRGRDEILSMLRTVHELTGGTYRAEPMWLVADDEHASVAYRATGEREGRSVDIVQVLACTVREGRLAEVLALPADPNLFAEFWA